MSGKRPNLSEYLKPLQPMTMLFSPFRLYWTLFSGFHVRNNCSHMHSRCVFPNSCVISSVYIGILSGPRGILFCYIMHPQFLAPVPGRPRDTRQHSGSTRDPHKGHNWFTCCKHKVLYVLNLVARQYLALFADNARGSPRSCDLPNVHLDMFSNTCSLTFYKRL